ncbi:SIMPL domain-containing protein [Patescibacteria group bacterium]
MADPTHVIKGAGEMLTPKKGKSVFKMVLGVLVVVFLWFLITNPLVITVTGSGEISTMPDSAVISFVVSSRNSNPQAATSAVLGKVALMKTILERYGLEEDLVQSQVTVLPPALTQIENTYDASITVSAKVVDYGKAGELVALLYTNGADIVTQPILSVDDTDMLEKEALDKAMDDAGKQANMIAMRNWKLFKRKVAVTQVTTPTTSSVTSKTAPQGLAPEEGIPDSSETFKVAKVVSVVYKMW